MKMKNKWSKIAIGALALTAIIAVAGNLYASGGGEGGSMTGPHGSLSPAKIKDFGWRVMNFAALVVILLKFLKKPLVDALKGRQQGIAAEFEDLETRRADGEREYNEYAGKLAGIDDELKAMVEKAIAQGQVEKERIIEEANNAAENIKRQAEMAIQNEITEAKRRLKSEVTEQAAIMAEEIIKKNLQPTDQDKLVEDYLTKIGGLK
ncbi:MAG: F0F1 ATP synthase subunit B [Desulfobulbaceae bacterium]|nr:F0F1 ATP synthase subunit B [Desulfobulbaceae bacterium]